MPASVKINIQGMLLSQLMYTALAHWLMGCKNEWIEICNLNMDRIVMHFLIAYRRQMMTDIIVLKSWNW